MENDKVSPSTEWFDLVVRGVLVPTLGFLGMIFNIMIIIVLRRPEFTKVSINLIMLCKFTHTMYIEILMAKTQAISNSCKNHSYLMYASHWKNKPESFQPLKASQTFQYFKKYSRVHISSDKAFFKILKKPSIVQK